MQDITLWRGSVFAFVALALGGPAMAADIPVAMPAKAPVVAPLYEGWAGAYIGVAGGYGWGRSQQTDPTGFDSARYDVDGGLVGLTWGRNWQFGQWVLGLENDMSKTWLRGSTSANGACGAGVCSSELRWLGTTRGRVGLAWNQFMPYLTAGIAYGGLHGQEGNVLVPGVVGSGTHGRHGVAAGAGLEAMLTPSLTAKAEYLYVDLRKGDTFDALIGGALVPQSLDFHSHIVRVGLNYKYDPGRPAAPTYAGYGKAPAYAVPTWTGSYVGVSAGGGWGRSSHTTPAVSTGDFDVSGGLVGGTMGFNHQVGSWVWGIENDLSWTGLDGSAGVGGATFESRLRWLETLRGRTGYAYGSVLPYVTGGVAFADVKATLSTPGASVSGNSTHAGWTVGTGLEYAFAPNWSAKVEYLYVDLGTDTKLATDDVDLKTHVVRAGVNYRYDLSALLGLLPISSKY